MSEPQDHSQSGFDRGDEAGGGPPGGPGAGPADEAQRFWSQYARRTRSGSQRGDAGAGDPRVEAGNGQGTAAGHPHECLEWCPICRTADVLRSTASPELRGQIQSLQRDALVTLRALIDAYLERIEDGPARRRTEVEDIRIE
jgi:hypothetical protein